MIPTIAPYLLPKIIENLARMHPELDIHVRETLTPKLIQELAEGRLDTAIVALPVSEPSLTEVALFAENFLLVRPGEDEGTPVPSREMLREMRLLLLEEGHCFRDQALSFCNMQSAPPREMLDANSLSTLVQMVSAGIGVTLIPEMAVAVETRSASGLASPASRTRSRRAPSAWSGARPARWRGQLLQISEVVCLSARQGARATPRKVACRSKPDLRPRCRIPSSAPPAPTNMTRSPASGWRAGFRPGSARPANSCWRICAHAFGCEIEEGWSLFVADDNGTIAAMLALHLPKLYLDQLFVAPEYQGQIARPKAARLHAHAIAGRDFAALRARKRKGLALV